ncbi:DUF3558 domain-containing protein [Nocardia alba]|uniref:Uncharacterized protein DUF3558 n=1 Tax=Nocardia alba TaxID=225051 RepID=A0A4R1G2M8_9NOCA|nr:uncharacterized protein DUF3558 [Nocardia alba]
MKRAGTAIVIAGFAVVGLVGCDSGESTSKGATSTAKPVLWNPCTEIPDAALTAAGVDPATEEKGVAGVPQPGWEICGWMAPKYGLTVYTSAKSLAEFEAKPGNADFADTTVAGRPARKFRVAGDSRNLICDVVFETRDGVVQLEVMNRASLDGLEEPCVYLNSAASALVPTFPR